MLFASMYLQQLVAFVDRVVSREEGQDFAEYAIIFALVVLVAAVAFGTLGTNIGTTVDNVASAVTGVLP